MTIEDILTPADKQFVIKYALENIKALAEDRHLPGYNAIPLYHGQSIIHAAISEELIVNMFSLHDKDFMKRLGVEWWNLKRLLKPQPIEKIRKYFGDAIGIYFSFVGEMSKIEIIRMKTAHYFALWKVSYENRVHAIFIVSIPFVSHIIKL